MAIDLVLVIDVGNSGTKLGVVRGEDVAGPVRLPRNDAAAVREFAKPLVRDEKPLVAVCGSDAVKAKDLAWELAKVGFPGAVVVAHDHPGLPRSRAHQPETAGVDRRVQVLGASTIVAGPAVVVSCGTALTIDVAGADGALLGGTIGIGLGLAARALTVGAEKLPLVDLKGAVPLPALDTEAALRSGIVLGAAGGVERILEGLRPDPACPVFLTGLDAALLSPHLRVPHRVHLGLGLLGVAAALRRSPPSPGQGLIGGVS
ncbi:MAG: type III pantothenate kinase [Planctomycetia bacterium]|nr:type III pantothenate kinase [Planctomycetia bacterium]